MTSPASHRGDRPVGVLHLLPEWLARGAMYCLALLTLAVTAWLVATALFTVSTVTIGVLAAVLLTALLRPVVRRLRRLHLPAWLAALTTLLLMLGTIAATIFLVVRRAREQFDDLQQTVSDALDNAQELLLSSPLQLSRQRLSEIGDQILSFLQAVLPSPATGASLFLEFISGAGIALFVLFFLLKDGPGMWRWFLGWLPASRRDRADGAGHRAWVTLTSYVHGAVVVALVDAVFIGAAMFVMGVPLALSLTVIIFLGAFVPFVGATVSGALAVGVTLVTLGPLQAIILLGVVLLVQFVEGNILQPFVMGYAVNLHPVVILLAVSTGAALSGIIGAIIAVPVVGVSYRVIEYLSGPHQPTETAEDVT